MAGGTIWIVLPITQERAAEPAGRDNNVSEVFERPLLWERHATVSLRARIRLAEFGNRVTIDPLVGGRSRGLRC